MEREDGKNYIKFCYLVLGEKWKTSNAESSHVEGVTSGCRCTAGWSTGPAWLQLLLPWLPAGPLPGREGSSRLLWPTPPGLWTCWPHCPGRSYESASRKRSRSGHVQSMFRAIFANNMSRKCKLNLRSYVLLLSLLLLCYYWCWKIYDYHYVLVLLPSFIFSCLFILFFLLLMQEGYANWAKASANTFSGIVYFLWKKNWINLLNSLNRSLLFL